MEPLRRAVLCRPATAAARAGRAALGAAHYGRAGAPYRPRFCTHVTNFPDFLYGKCKSVNGIDRPAARRALELDHSWRRWSGPRLTKTWREKIAPLANPVNCESPDCWCCSLSVVGVMLDSYALCLVFLRLTLWAGTSTKTIHLLKYFYLCYDNNFADFSVRISVALLCVFASL